MKSTDYLTELNHHAYCIVGNVDDREELLAVLKKKHKLQAQGNPDFFDKNFETFTIDDAREIKSLAETKPVAVNGRKIFILSMLGITVEAQNALLKLLEEPPEYAHFFLIIPSAHLLLPTVKSRFAMISDHSRQKNSAANRSESDAELVKSAESFLKMAPTKRLDFVKSFMDEITKEKRPKQDAIDFLNAVEEALYEKGLKGNVDKLEAVKLSRKYMNDRAPSLKMLLEYVAMAA